MELSGLRRWAGTIRGRIFRDVEGWKLADKLHGFLDIVMLMEVAAGAVFLGAVLVDWALDRVIRSLKLQHCFLDFMFKWVRDRKKQAGGS